VVKVTSGLEAVVDFSLIQKQFSSVNHLELDYALRQNYRPMKLAVQDARVTTCWFGAVTSVPEAILSQLARLEAHQLLVVPTKVHF